MALAMQLVGLLAFIGFLFLVWAPLALAAGAVLMFLAGWALESQPAHNRRDDE